VVPSGSGTIYSWNTSRKEGLIYVSIFLLVMIIVFRGLVYIGRSNYDLIKLNNLHKENQKLLAEMTEFSHQMDILLLRIKVMEYWEDHQRETRDLKSVSSALRNLGFGGEPYTDLTFFPFQQEIHDIFNENLNKLLFLSAKVNLTYNTHYDLLEAIRLRELQLNGTPSIWPTFGKITSNFGLRHHPIYHYNHFHGALDIANEAGTPVYATAEGVVAFADYQVTWGNIVRINHTLNYQTRYAHLEKIIIKKGNFVHKGQIIGYMGRTGNTTGPHLHYEIYDLASKTYRNPNSYVDLSDEQIVANQYLKNK